MDLSISESSKAFLAITKSLKCAEPVSAKEISRHEMARIFAFTSGEHIGNVMLHARQLEDHFEAQMYRANAYYFTITNKAIREHFNGETEYSLSVLKLLGLRKIIGGWTSEPAKNTVGKFVVEITEIDRDLHPDS